tara:strand:+ start:4864 stop:6273 length:1410 start_codon:yes stop_codon:yes gene_type:complete
MKESEFSICPVIIAGGSGTRLWPLSRAGYPKQFLNLYGDDTMLQATLKRLSGLNVEPPVIICNEKHRFFVAEQLREIDQLGSIILEPLGRNTAPAIALAAMSVENDPLLLVLSADHIIQDKIAFTEAVERAVPLANEGKLVTFGVVPDEAHTGYGYIKTGLRRGAGFYVDDFVEKPSVEAAQQYVNSEKYFWNSGMFLFRASRYLEELNKFRPDIYEACKLSTTELQSDLDFIRIENQAFESCASESIDYAVMEKTTDAIMVKIDAGWSDIGSWSSLWDVSKKDENGNVVHGDVMLHDSNNSYVRSDGKLVAAIGVNDLIIVSTKDSVMVARKDCAQNVNVITQKLKTGSRREWELHREVHRPWGKYDSIDAGECYQVKRITVKPHAKLSLQKHEYRSEHWIVVSGTARVTNGERTFLLSENESTYIPVGIVHSLENPGVEDLELIEVQSGSYLGEDDIIRFEDIYGRS